MSENRRTEALNAPSREIITGCVLAGGRGQRMGGLDKGLQTLHGQPLAAHAAARLAPQVSCCLISANRHLDDYRTFGFPVWEDAFPDQPGPLAGMLTGLTHASTPWLACVPCDGPDFPIDLVARLADAVARTNAPIAYACTPDTAAGSLRQHPVYALIATHLHSSLAEALIRGERRVMKWMQSQGAVEVAFENARDFLNVNTLEDLAVRHRVSSS